MARWTTAPTLLVTAVLLGGVLAGCGGSDDSTDSDGDTGSDTTSESTPTTEAATSLELTVPAAQTGRCMAPNVDNLEAQDTAFEGVVTTAADGTATLDVTQSFKGDDVDTVTVKAPSADLAGLVLAVDFQQGQTYLVSSLDGQVSVCGLSAVKDDLLADLYQQAYAG